MENQFKTQLVKLRRARQLSQEQLASQIFVTRQAVSKWEQGETTPDLTTLLRLAAVLDVDLNALVTGQAAMTPQVQPVPRPVSHLNGWEFMARYWWTIIPILGSIGVFFGH